MEGAKMVKDPGKVTKAHGDARQDSVDRHSDKRTDPRHKEIAQDRKPKEAPKPSTPKK
jgi:hypothetical protein